MDRLTQQQINHLQDMSGNWPDDELEELKFALETKGYSRSSSAIKKLIRIIFNPGGRFAPFIPLPIQTRSEDTGLNHYATLGEAFNAASKDDSIWKISFSFGNERVRLRKCQNIGWIYEPIGSSVNTHLRDLQDEDFKRGR